MILNETKIMKAVSEFYDLLSLKDNFCFWIENQKSGKDEYYLKMDFLEFGDLSKFLVSQEIKK